MSQCPVLSLVQVLPRLRKKNKKEEERVIDIEGKELQGWLQVISEETSYVSSRLTESSRLTQTCSRCCYQGLCRGVVMTCRKNHRVTNSA